MSLDKTWSLSAKAIGQPVIADGVAVVYTMTDTHELRMLGLDAKTGRQLWSHPASPGFGVPGSALSPLVSADVRGRNYAVYLRPGRDADQLANTRIVAADLHSGRDLVVSRPITAYSYLHGCADVRDACVTATLGTTDDSAELRLNLRSGKLSHDKSERLPPNAQRVGNHGLYVLTDPDSNIQELGAVVDGVELWQRPVAEIFDYGYASWYGWSWQYSKKDDLYVGLLGSIDFPDDLGSVTTVALDGSTGAVRWSHENIDLNCGGTFGVFPSPGDSLPNAVGCAYRGSIAYGDDGKWDHIDNLDVTMKGYDPVSGKVLWTLPAGAEDSLVFDSTWRFLSDSAHPRIMHDGAATVLDVRTGHTTKAKRHARLLCAKAFDFNYFVPFDDEIKGYRTGGWLAASCDAHLKPRADFALTTANARALGLSDGGPYVVALRDSIAGFGR